MWFVSVLMVSPNRSRASLRIRARSSDARRTIAHTTSGSRPAGRTVKQNEGRLGLRRAPPPHPQPPTDALPAGWMGGPRRLPPFAAAWPPRCARSQGPRRPSPGAAPKPPEHRRRRWAQHIAARAPFDTSNLRHGLSVGPNHDSNDRQIAFTVWYTVLAAFTT